jgi:hypothetical protein
MQTTIQGVTLEVKPCEHGDVCQGERVVSNDHMVGHIQRSQIHHRSGHGLEVSERCTLGKRVYGGTTVGQDENAAKLAALRIIAGWVTNR